MRVSRSVGLVVSSVICGALAFGPTSAAAAAPAALHPEASSAEEAPIPNADALTSLTGAVQSIVTVLKPVTGLLKAVLASGEKLPEADAATHKKAIDEALKSLEKAAPADSSADAGADLKAKAITDLKVRADGLLKSATAGDAAVVATDVKSVLTGLVNVISSILVGSGLPPADLEGLPKMPKQPKQPAVEPKLPDA